MVVFMLGNSTEGQISAFLFSSLIRSSIQTEQKTGKSQFEEPKDCPAKQAKNFLSIKQLVYFMTVG